MSVVAVTFDFLDPAPRGAVGAAARVYTALQQAIVRGELKPGAELDRVGIADRMGVSRFPVGEAFSRLKAEGLVDIFPRWTTKVSLIRLKDVRENIFIRRSLETETVRQIAKSLRSDTIESLKRNLKYARTATDTGDREGFYQFDLDFHALLFSELGFERVQSVSETARLGLERVRRLSLSRRRQEDTLNEHQAIVDALVSRNGGEAARAMGQHLDSVMAGLEQLAVSTPEMFADIGRAEPA
jgi:DNA-binding GntR family transcriptional regulator